MRSQRVADFCAPMMTNVGNAPGSVGRSIELAMKLVEILRETDPEGIPAYDPDETPEGRRRHGFGPKGVGMDAAETGDERAELQRLRRQLRAQSVVNRQLYAQLDGGGVRVAAGAATSAAGTRKSLTVPRVTEGGSWLEQLQMHGGGTPFLVQTPTQGSYVIDGDMRRQVKAGMLFAALASVIGSPRDVA